MSSGAQASSARTYLVIWFWLAGLMLVSVALSELPLPPGTIVSLVLLLSTVKALLVALYYMHLKMDSRLLTLVATFPLVVIAVAVLVVASSRLVTL